MSSAAIDPPFTVNLNVTVAMMAVIDPARQFLEPVAADHAPGVTATTMKATSTSLDSYYE